VASTPSPFAGKQKLFSEYFDGERREKRETFKVPPLKKPSS